MAADRGRVGRRAPAVDSLNYDGELAGSILLEDGDTVTEEANHRQHYSFRGGPSQFGGASPFFSGTDLEASADSSSPPASLRAPGHQRSGGEGPAHTPTRTPSPVYQWNHPKKVSIGDSDDLFPPPSRFPMPSSPAAGAPREPSAAGGASGGSGSGNASSAPGGGAGSSSGGANPYDPAQAFQQFAPFFNPYLAAASGLNPYGVAGMMMQSPLLGQQAAVAQAAAASSQMSSSGGATSGGGGSGASGAAPAGGALPSLFSQQQPAGGQGDGAGMPPFPMENYIQMMLAMQAGLQAQGAAASNAGTQMQGSEPSNSTVAPLPTGPVAPTTLAVVEASREVSEMVPSQELSGRGRGQGGGGAEAAGGRLQVAEGKRGKNRGKDAALAKAPAPEVAAPKERGGKGERRRRGGAGVPEDEPKAAGGGGGDGGKSSKSRSLEARPSSNPIIEQLKARGKIELSDLTGNISEIAQDQYGSRLIQQKLEVANEEEKQRAFKSILQNMPALTIDVFGNYVIQKFFEYGNAEQRRILAEQLVGQVMNLSLQMYGCRVVQKALDSVPIDQQVLLIGELKGHVIKCIEDQHGNHVIQKCIERLPTDKINFIVESFDAQACRMAKHCYGCRVIQRLIEYCSSMQISTLLDEVLRNCMDLATDQYGNYVVQHVMEHSSRPNDRQSILFLVRKNINQLSCHKYASNVVEKALSCSTREERALIINAIVGEPGDSHPPLLTMMRDRFGNYIVQRTISAAQSPQREALLWKLQEQMPALKKSNTYGKHIISAIEKAQAEIARGN